jgi:hypothetical protein
VPATLISIISALGYTLHRLFSTGSDGTPTNPGHVGMYIGSGLVIEAP